MCTNSWDEHLTCVTCPHMKYPRLDWYGWLEITCCHILSIGNAPKSMSEGWRNTIFHLFFCQVPLVTSDISSGSSPLIWGTGTGIIYCDGCRDGLTQEQWQVNSLVKIIVKIFWQLSVIQRVFHFSWCFFTKMPCHVIQCVFHHPGVL